MHCIDSDIIEIADRLSDIAPRFEGATVLITGGAGFLGRYFTDVLLRLNESRLKRPCRVIVCDNLITSGDLGRTVNGNGQVEFLEHDVIKPLEIDGQVDYIIHAAGIASPYYYRKYPLETLEVATVGTKRVLEFGLRHGVKGFLFFSSSEIYGDPDARHVPTPESYRGNVSCVGPRACYDESKRLGETMCMIYHEAFGVPTRVVRPFNVYGPGMQERDYRVLPNFASRIAAGKPLRVYGHGSQTRTFCYITDAMVGFTRALVDGAPGQAYNIGNPTPEISMLHLVKVLEKVIAKSLVCDIVEYPDSYPADEPQRRCPDISKAAIQLKYKPQVSLEDGLQRFISWTKGCYTGAEF